MTETGPDIYKGHNELRAMFTRMAGHAAVQNDERYALRDPAAQAAYQPPSRPMPPINPGDIDRDDDDAHTIKDNPTGAEALNNATTHYNPEALQQAAQYVRATGAEISVNLGGLAGATESPDGEGDAAKRKRFEEYMFNQALELARDLADTMQRMAALAADMDEIAAKYLSPDDMQRQPGESEDAYRDRQYHLLKAAHDRGEVPDDVFQKYQDDYRQWKALNEHKAEIQKKLNDPEYQKQLQLIAQRQQELAQERESLAKREADNNILLMQLRALQNNTAMSDTERDAAFVRLMHEHPEAAKRYEQETPDAANQTTDQKIASAMQSTEKDQAEITKETDDVVKKQKSVTIDSGEKIINQYLKKDDGLTTTKAQEDNRISGAENIASKYDNFMLPS